MSRFIISGFFDDFCYFSSFCVPSSSRSDLINNQISMIESLSPFASINPDKDLNSMELVVNIAVELDSVGSINTYVSTLFVSISILIILFVATVILV